jgi:hypothetical protein
LNLICRSGIVLKPICRSADFPSRVRQGLSVIPTFRCGEFTGPFAQQAGKCEQSSAAFRGGKLSPGTVEGGSSSFDCTVDINFIRFRNLRPDLTG